MSNRGDMQGRAAVRDRNIVPILGSFNPVRGNPATALILVLMGSVYLVQLYLAGSAAPEAAYRAIAMVPIEVYVALSPWLHSYHVHVITNGLIFALLGGWTERRMESIQFALIVLIAGYITNFVPFIAGFGGLGIGASGITNTLWAYFAVTQFYLYIRVVQASMIDYRLAARRAIFSVVGLVWVLKAIGEFGGLIAPPPGTAVEGHFLGVVLGLVWFLYHYSGLSGGEYRSPLQT